MVKGIADKARTSGNPGKPGDLSVSRDPAARDPAHDMPHLFVPQVASGLRMIPLFLCPLIFAVIGSAK
jgi:hypothetical protein